MNSRVIAYTAVSLAKGTEEQSSQKPPFLCRVHVRPHHPLVFGFNLQNISQRRNLRPKEPALTLVVTHLLDRTYGTVVETARSSDHATLP